MKCPPKSFLLQDVDAHVMVIADMEFVQKFTPPDFQAKNFHRQFHLILTVLVRKNTKNE